MVNQIYLTPSYVSFLGDKEINLAVKNLTLLNSCYLLPLLLKEIRTNHPVSKAWDITLLLPVRFFVN